MKNSWAVKNSGKLDILIISYSTIFLIYTYFFIRYIYPNGENFTESFFFFLLIFLPITIALILTPFTMLRKKKMVKSLTIDEDSRNINFTFFNKRSPYKLEFNNLAYQKIEKDLFTILVFYERKLATRGHILHFELHSIFALFKSTSWKKEQIFEIINRLKELNIEEYKPLKQKIIIDYIIK